jgi:hypothetical protein
MGRGNLSSGGCCELGGAHVAGAEADVDAGKAAVQLFNASPAAFIENKGQIDDPSVRYAFYGNGANIFHTTSGPVFQVFQRTKSSSSSSSSNPSPRPPTDYRKRTRAGNSLGASLSLPLPEDAHRPCGRDADRTIHSHAFSAIFLGAKKVMPTGADLNKAKVNYYIGKKASNWHTNIPTYATVVYPGLYNGIDLYTYGRRTHLKYEFHVAAGATYKRIVIKYSGIDGLSVDARGALQVITPLGELIDDAPYIYQVINGRKVEVAGRYRLIDGSSYTFEITGAVDPTRELVIDPNIVWSRFLGGSGDDWGMGIAADANGNALITGYTKSSDFPTSGGFDTSLAGRDDVFVAKVSPDGQLIWRTI